MRRWLPIRRDATLWRGPALALLCAALSLAAGCDASSSTTSRQPAATPAVSSTAVGATLPAVDYLHAPPGFRVTLFAGGMQEPRFMAFSPDGTLYVAERRGDIVALPDPQHTGKAAQRVVAASGLDGPSSLVFHDGALYVGENSRVSRYTLGAGDHLSDRQVIVPNLPTGGNHTTRTVLYGPDGRLYVSIGSTCNDCVEQNPQRATVQVYNADGSDGRTYARGLRNAVGMAINPWTNEIWVTNNGRDNLGDNTPPETIYALRDGANYGWPTCHAGTIVDPDLGKPGACDGVEQPLVKMQAHSAPLGLTFYKDGPFPAQYHGLFVAFHGSWNRTEPTGYKVVYIPLDGQGHVAGQPQDFVTGWREESGRLNGRPAGVTVGPDGALYVSDDTNGNIYRVVYTG